MLKRKSVNKLAINKQGRIQRGNNREANASRNKINCTNETEVL